MRNFIFLLSAAVFSVYASEEQLKESPSQSELLSKALGHLLGQNLRSLEIPLDMEAIAQGLLDEVSGISSPLTEEDCSNALFALQQQAHAEKKQKYIQQAEAFLAENGEKLGVHVQEEGKLQWEVLQEGAGEKVEESNSPLVRYRVHKLDHPDSKMEPIEERIVLEETIAGLAKGLVGMQEGEIRKLYIHPELCNEEHGMLIFEVEVLQASSQAAASDRALISQETEVLPVR